MDADECNRYFSEMDAGKRCCSFCCCTFFIALVVYAAVAIEGVEPTEYAIIRNNIS